MGSDEGLGVRRPYGLIKAPSEMAQHALYRQRGRRRVLRPEDRLPSAQTSLGRTWQCGTIQLDFQMPLNFGLEYIAEDGSRQRPIMIHRVCFGSIERFIGILTEHFAGKFPTWLAPTQVKVLPVSDKSMDYAKEVYEALREKMIRCELDTRNEKIGYKIREARQVDRVPYMLIIGAKEVEMNTVSVRDRDTDETVTMTLDEFLGKLCKQIEERA